MAPTIGGQDPEHDLPASEKEKRERELRAMARNLFVQGKKKERDRLNLRAKEISRKKSKKAHQGTD
jgi:hypothetical protein